VAGDLVPGDEIGPVSAAVSRFLPIGMMLRFISFIRDAAHADVVHDRVCRYHIEVTVGRDVLASLADHDVRLGLVVGLDRNFRDMFRPLSPDVSLFWFAVCVGAKFTLACG
jgi:hypothetical protein